MSYEHDIGGIEAEGAGDPEFAPLDWTEPMMRIINLRKERGKKFTAPFLKSHLYLEEGVLDYLSQIGGDTGFDFIDTLAARVQEGKAISPGQIAGVCNSMWVAYDRERQQKALAPKPVVEISGRSHRGDGMVMPKVPNGFYLLRNEGRSHILQLRTCTDRDRRPGVQTVSLKVGENQYKDFAYAVGSHFEPWTRSKVGRHVEDAASVLLSTDFRIYGREYAFKTNLCYHCNLSLTLAGPHPSGLHSQCQKNLSILYGDLTLPPMEPDYAGIEKELVQKYILMKELEKGPLGTKAEQLGTMYELEDVADLLENIDRFERAAEDDIHFRNDGPDNEEDLL